MKKSDSMMNPQENQNDWRPYCGFNFPLERTAGVPIICDRQVHNTEKEKHFNSETGFSWWQITQGGKNVEDQR
jgi:hypothetical protein